MRMPHQNTRLGKNLTLTSRKAKWAKRLGYSHLLVTSNFHGARATERFQLQSHLSMTCGLQFPLRLTVRPKQCLACHLTERSPKDQCPPFPPACPDLFGQLHRHSNLPTGLAVLLGPCLVCLDL